MRNKTRGRVCVCVCGVYVRGVYCVWVCEKERECCECRSGESKGERERERKVKELANRKKKHKTIKLFHEINLRQTNKNLYKLNCILRFINHESNIRSDY